MYAVIETGGKQYRVAKGDVEAAGCALVGDRPEEKKGSGGELEWEAQDLA